MFISSSHKGHISLMALTAAHFLPNNILFSFCVISFLINFANVAVLCSRLNFLSLCCCFTSFNLAFIFTGESCGSLRVLLNFPFRLRLFRHILHMRCRTMLKRKALFGFEIWPTVAWRFLWLLHLSDVFVHALFLHLRLYSLFYPSLLGRFIIKHFSLNILQFRMIVTFVSSGCR